MISAKMKNVDDCRRAGVGPEITLTLTLTALITHQTTCVVSASSVLRSGTVGWIEVNTEALYVTYRHFNYFQTHKQKKKRKEKKTI